MSGHARKPGRRLFPALLDIASTTFWWVVGLSLDRRFGVCAERGPPSNEIGTEGDPDRRSEPQQAAEFRRSRCLEQPRPPSHAAARYLYQPSGSAAFEGRMAIELVEDPWNGEHIERCVSSGTATQRLHACVPSIPLYMICDPYAETAHAWHTPQLRRSLSGRARVGGSATVMRGSRSSLIKRRSSPDRSSRSVSSGERASARTCRCGASATGGPVLVSWDDGNFAF